MSFSKYLSLQVGSGLNGQERNSYALYNASLVDDPLQASSPGCNRTIAFWFLVPSSSGSTEAFTTIGQLGTSNPADTIGNSGIRVAHINRLTIICLYDKENIRHHYGADLLTEGAWTHIAFSYSGTTDFAYYINFTRVNPEFATLSFSKVTAEPFMGSGILNGASNNVTGFGVIDELLVFPDVLSPSQIAKLNQTVNKIP